MQAPNVDDSYICANTIPNEAEHTNRVTRYPPPAHIDAVATAFERRMNDNRANISELEQEIGELEEAIAVARELRRELFAQEDKAQRYKAVAKVLVETLNEGAWLMPSGMGLNVTALESRKVITEALEEYLKD